MESAESLPIESATQPSPGGQLPGTGAPPHVQRATVAIGIFHDGEIPRRIEIWPGFKRHDIRNTNEGVLPARFTFAVTQVTLIVGRALRALFGR